MVNAKKAKSPVYIDAEWIKNFRERILDAAGVASVADLQRKMAPLFDVSYQTVNRYLNGEREIPVEFIFQIQRVTGKPFSWILTGQTGGEVDVDEVKREGAKDFLAEMVGYFSNKYPVQSQKQKTSRRA